MGVGVPLGNTQHAVSCYVRCRCIRYHLGADVVRRRRVAATHLVSAVPTAFLFACRFLLPPACSSTHTHSVRAHRLRRSPPLPRTMCVPHPIPLLSTPSCSSTHSVCAHRLRRLPAVPRTVCALVRPAPPLLVLPPCGTTHRLSVRAHRLALASPVFSRYHAIHAHPAHPRRLLAAPRTLFEQGVWLCAQPGVRSAAQPGRRQIPRHSPTSVWIELMLCGDAFAVGKKALENGLAFALSACGLVCVLCSLRISEWRTLSRVVAPKELLCAGVVVVSGGSGGRFESWLCEFKREDAKPHRTSLLTSCSPDIPLRARLSKVSFFRPPMLSGIGPVKQSFRVSAGHRTSLLTSHAYLEIIGDVPNMLILPESALSARSRSSKD
jgi:hypothetical protein